MVEKRIRIIFETAAQMFLIPPESFFRFVVARPAPGHPSAFSVVPDAVVPAIRVVCAAALVVLVAVAPAILAAFVGAGVGSFVPVEILVVAVADPITRAGSVLVPLAPVAALATDAAVLVAVAIAPDVVVLAAVVTAPVAVARAGVSPRLVFAPLRLCVSLSLPEG